MGPDEVLRRRIIARGWATPEQIRGCEDILAARRKRGDRVTLADVLVEWKIVPARKILEVQAELLKVPVHCDRCGRRGELASKYAEQGVACKCGGRVVMEEGVRVSRPAPPRLAAPVARRRKIPTAWVAAGAAGIFVFAGLVWLATRGGPGPEPAASPPAAPPAAPIDWLAKADLLERELGGSFRTLHQRLSDLATEADADAMAGLADRIERVKAQAAAAARESAAPVMGKVHALVERGDWKQARALLQSWTVPDELDLDGAVASERARDLECLDGLAGLADLERDLRTALERGDSPGVEALLAPYVASSHEPVRFRVLQIKPELELLSRLAGCWRALRAGGPRPARPAAIEAKSAAGIPSAVTTLWDRARVVSARMVEASTLRDYVARAQEGEKLLADAAAAASWLGLAEYYRGEWALDAMGDAGTALARLDRAIDVTPSLLEARLARLVALERLGRDVAVAHKELSAALPAASREVLARSARDAWKRVVEGQLAESLEGEPHELPAWTHTAVVETEHYVIRAEAKGDAAERQAVVQRIQRMVGDLEAARAWYARVVPPAPKPGEKVPVYLIASREEYVRVAADDAREALAPPLGFFQSSPRRICLLDRPDAADLRRILIHEGAHEYVQAAVGSLPKALDEGLAEYLGLVETRDGRVASEGAPHAGWLRYLEWARKTGWTGRRIESLLTMDRAEFNGPEVALNYAQAWSFVQFLRHHLDGKRAPALARLLERVAAGEAAAKVVDELFPPSDREALHAEWLEYVDSLIK